MMVLNVQRIIFVSSSPVIFKKSEIISCPNLGKDNLL